MPEVHKPVARMGKTRSHFLAVAAMLLLGGCAGDSGADGGPAVAGADDRNAMILEISGLERQLAAEKARGLETLRDLQRAGAEIEWLAAAAQSEPALKARIDELEQVVAGLTADNQRIGVLEAELKDLGAENERLSSALKARRDPAPQAGGEQEPAAPGNIDATAIDASEDFEAGNFAVHLASYRSRAAAEHGWSLLHAQYPDLLASLIPHIKIFDVASLGGRYFRLKAGPIDGAAAARRLCAAMNADGSYCVVSVFDGDPLSGEGEQE